MRYVDLRRGLTTFCTWDVRSFPPPHPPPPHELPQSIRTTLEKHHGAVVCLNAVAVGTLHEQENKKPVAKCTKKDAARHWW